MNPESIADLARSGISPEQAEAAGIYCVDNAQEVYPDFDPLPALVIPYYTPDGAELFTFPRDDDAAEFARVRYLGDMTNSRGFKKKKAQRYGQPLNSGIHAYFPQGVGIDWPEVLANPKTPILITEGEKKAIASCLAGYPTVGLGGVFNFASGGELLKPLQDITWRHRGVFIVFDSDAATNPNILAAEGRLAQELSLKHSAEVHVVRLPELDGEKCGIDDLLQKRGANDFYDILDAAPQVRKIDAEVLALNEEVCWLDRDGMVYELATGLFIQKHNFVSGTKYSTRKLIQPTKKGAGTVEVSVASEWLTHPHSQRYADVIFDPATTESTVKRETGVCLNTWKGFTTAEGNVTPFLRLADYIFSGLPAEHRELPMKLLAYRFQNPGTKTPLSLVLLGKQRSGKSMWAKLVKMAAGRYGYQVPSKALLGDFNGWIESSLIAVMDEAQSKHVAKGADMLKGLISEDSDMLNEKFRVARQVKTYTFYILTSNDRGVGNFGADDQRMIVVNCPGPHPDGKEFYSAIMEWANKENGAAKIANYFINYDLKGWTPPVHAPMTSEKYMAFIENLSPVERLAVEMQTADENTIALWISQSLEWAAEAEVGNDPAQARRARDILSSMSRMPIRPWYTPEELAQIFPALGDTLHGRRGAEMTSGAISKQLRGAGIPYLICKDDPRGFTYRGRLMQFLVVADPDEWSVPLSQADFDRIMGSWPSYADYAQAQYDKFAKKGKK